MWFVNSCERKSRLKKTQKNKPFYFINAIKCRSARATDKHLWITSRKYGEIYQSVLPIRHKWLKIFKFLLTMKPIPSACKIFLYWLLLSLSFLTITEKNVSFSDSAISEISFELLSNFIWISSLFSSLKK